MASVRFFGRSALIICVTLLAGCGTVSKMFEQPHSLYDRNGLDILVEDSSRKTTVIKDKSSFERICRSPSPDYATGQSDSISLGFASGPSVGSSSGAAIDSLGGRSSALMITRELMYRACELALNLDANEGLSKEIYWKFLGTIEIALKSQTSAGAQGSTASVSSTSSAPPVLLRANPSPGLPGMGGSLPGMGGSTPSTPSTPGGGGPFPWDR